MRFFGRAMSGLFLAALTLALLGAGWFTSCLVGAVMGAGGVAVSYGFAAREHLLGGWLPNTEGVPASAWAQAM